MKNVTLSSAMLVKIWSDIACPWCYVGKRRFEAALKAFPHADNVQVTWRSFELDPTAPQEHVEPEPERLARKYRTIVQEVQRMNARMTDLGEGASLGNVAILEALASEVGLDASAGRSVLKSNASAEAVRSDEADAQSIGVTGVPFFVLGRKYGVS